MTCTRCLHLRSLSSHLRHMTHLYVWHDSPTSHTPLDFGYRTTKQKKRKTYKSIRWRAIDVCTWTVYLSSNVRDTTRLYVWHDSSTSHTPRDVGHRNKTKPNKTQSITRRKHSKTCTQCLHLGYLSIMGVIRPVYTCDMTHLHPIHHVTLDTATHPHTKKQKIALDDLHSMFALALSIYHGHY